MVLNPEQQAIVQAALHVLDRQWSRGTANSGFDDKTMKLLRKDHRPHESEARRLLDRLESRDFVVEFKRINSTDDEMAGNQNREGFWASRSEPALPYPVASSHKWEGQDDFVKVLKFKEGTTAQDLYRGLSVCRICGKPNGNGEFKLGSWLWPSGFKHYIEDHNVRPSLAFQEFIAGREVDSL